MNGVRKDSRDGDDDGGGDYCYCVVKDDDDDCDDDGVVDWPEASETIYYFGTAGGELLKDGEQEGIYSGMLRMG